MATLLTGIPIQYEPKRKNRFIVEFPSDLGIESWLVETSGRPKITHNLVNVEQINTTFTVLGKYKWENITITFKDLIGPSTSQKLMEWVRLASESVTGRQGYAVGYKKNLVLKSLDPTGLEIEKWVMHQCSIVSASFDDNSLSEDGLLMCTIEIAMDFAELEF